MAEAIGKLSTSEDGLTHACVDGTLTGTRLDVRSVALENWPALRRLGMENAMLKMRLQDRSFEVIAMFSKREWRTA